MWAKDGDINMALFHHFIDSLENDWREMVRGRSKLRRKSFPFSLVYLTWVLAIGPLFKGWTCFHLVG